MFVKRRRLASLASAWRFKARSLRQTLQFESCATGYRPRMSPAFRAFVIMWLLMIRIVLSKIISFRGAKIRKRFLIKKRKIGFFSKKKADSLRHRLSPKLYEKKIYFQNIKGFPSGNLNPPCVSCPRGRRRRGPRAGRCRYPAERLRCRRSRDFVVSTAKNQCFFIV